MEDCSRETDEGICFENKGRETDGQNEGIKNEQNEPE